MNRKAANRVLSPRFRLSTANCCIYEQMCAGSGLLTSLVPVPGDSSFLQVVDKGVHGRFAVIIVDDNTAY